MEGADGATGELEARLARYPADRYPVQHATTSFHLGMALADAGRLDEAEDALTAAARLLDREKLPAEHAKVLNALGAVLRMAGDLGTAARAFERAQACFERTGMAFEQGAALVNLGLVLREYGDEGAVIALQRGRALLDPDKVPGQAGAAARELGQALLMGGELHRARESLEEAVELAQRVASAAEVGTAANLLGLVHLAAGRPAEAVEAFKTAASAHPRSVRPDGYAMAKVNLALAHERSGDLARARLAARQALGAPVVPPPVREQALAVLGRLGTDSGDLMVVLRSEPHDRWLPAVREELARLLDGTVEERHQAATAWIDGQLRGDLAGDYLAEAWLGAVLELPSQALETLVGSLLEALREHPPDLEQRFKAQMSRAMARFHVPQLLRLRDTFDRIAAEVDQRSP